MRIWKTFDDWTIDKFDAWAGRLQEERGQLLPTIIKTFMIIHLTTVIAFLATAAATTEDLPDFIFFLALCLIWSLTTMARISSIKQMQKLEKVYEDNESIRNSMMALAVEWRTEFSILRLFDVIFIFVVMIPITALTYIGDVPGLSEMIALTVAMVAEWGVSLARCVFPREPNLKQEERELKPVTVSI